MYDVLKLPVVSKGLLFFYSLFIQIRSQKLCTYNMWLVDNVFLISFFFFLHFAIYLLKNRSLAYNVPQNLDFCWPAILNLKPL